MSCFYETMETLLNVLGKFALSIRRYAVNNLPPLCKPIFKTMELKESKITSPSFGVLYASIDLKHNFCIKL